MDLRTIEYLAYSGGRNHGWVFSGMDECLDQAFTKARLDLRTQLQGVAGNSVGAFFALARVCGFTAREFRSFLAHRLRDLNLTYDITALLSTMAITSIGIISPAIISNLVRDMIAAKYGILGRDVTLHELYTETNITLTITAYNVSRCETRAFTHTTDPDLPVEQAIRMSTAIPIFFPPVVYRNDVYVDGGVSENIPTRVPIDKAIVMFIQTYHNIAKAADMGTLDFLCRLMHPTHDNEIQYKMSLTGPADRCRFVSARVPCSFISSTVDFALTDRKREALIDMGYIHMMEVINPTLFAVTIILDTIARVTSH